MASSLFEKSISPIRLAIMVFLSASGISLLAFLVGWMGITEMDVLFPWSIATAFMLLYAIINSVLSLNADSFGKYWGQSIYSYMALAVLNGLVAWGLSGISIGEAGSYKFIYLVVTFGFLVFLSLVNFMKRIVQFAEKEEWSQPKPRKKK
ncbi:MAG: hypothetical protein R2792_04335 [Saprospiraceae bacterium]